MQELDDPWWHRPLPDNEMPGCLAFEAVLASSADMVVFVSGMSVFRNGVEFCGGAGQARRNRRRRREQPLVRRSPAQRVSLAGPTQRCYGNGGRTSFFGHGLVDALAGARQ